MSAPVQWRFSNFLVAKFTLQQTQKFYRYFVEKGQFITVAMMAMFPILATC